MNPRDVLKSELIGLEAEIVAAKNPTLKGIKGKITDETKNTITIGTKKILKAQVTIKMKIKNRIAIVKGEKLVARPEERIKKRNKI